jgi:pyridoxamine 5'-phosphate oxidase
VDKRAFSQELREEDAPTDPVELFKTWYEGAWQAGGLQPDAMALATSTLDGSPSVRMVLLKAVDSRGFVFFSNYESRKAQDLAANPQAALCFFWPELHREVRVEGKVEPLGDEESDAYFATRSLGSRLSAAASPQSRVISNRADLERRVRELSDTFGENVPRPRSWGGYRVAPFAYEFWQGRPNRLHDRLSYTARDDGSWAVARLAP